MIKIDKNDIKKLEKEYELYITIFDKKDKYGEYGTSNYPNVLITDYKGIKSKNKTYKLPKKDIGINWLKNKLDKESEYKNLQKVFQKLGISGNIYYTSFGFSYMNFLKTKDVFDKEVNILKQKLDDLNIEYSNEFSKAYWVYRFRISKSKSNIDKIKEVKNG